MFECLLSTNLWSTHIMNERGAEGALVYKPFALFVCWEILSDAIYESTIDNRKSYKTVRKRKLKLNISNAICKN